MLNRTIAPSINKASFPNFIIPKKYILLQNIPLYVVNTGSQELIRLEIVFDAGIIKQNKKAIASTVSSLMKEGTKTKSAKQIADTLDFYGAFLETDCSRDNATVALFCLNKHLKNVLPLVNEILHEATFLASEIALYINTQKQRLANNLSKVDYLSRIAFIEKIYGSNHPYGTSTSNAKDFDNITREDLILFYNNYYGNNPVRLVIAGFVTDDIIKDISTLLIFSGKENKETTVQINLLPAEQTVIKIPEAIQSGIRIGKQLYNKTHSDYMGLSVLTTILGGYFGSRLMKNIREEKGYTYGIGASLSSLKHSGYLVIGTEVGKEVTQLAIDEIYKEIDLLKTIAVKQDELETVKSYLLGLFLRNTDGAFAQADHFSALVDWDLDYNYYRQYFETVKNISTQNIQELANNYFNNFTQIIAGNV